MSRGALPEELWGRLHQAFEVDDGSLPTVELRNLKGDEVGRLYSAIRDGSRVASRNATFWDSQQRTERALDDVPNAALLVSTGRAAPFHFAIEVAGVEETAIPTLGIHVFQDLIAIDYRMGGDWGAPQVFALFTWLEGLLRHSQAGVLEPAAQEGPPDPDAFMFAWNLFRQQQQGERQRHE